MRCIQNLALVGFMGTGKTSAGRLAAGLLQFEFVDTDELIEARSGLSVVEIFQKQGEAAFRKLEQDVVRDLGRREKTVIATGGGLVTDPANLASLKNHALVVCLWATPEIIWDRVRTETHRPLLQTADPLGKIREILAGRDSFYREADAHIDTGQRSPGEVAREVLLQFQLAQK